MKLTEAVIIGRDFSEPLSDSDTIRVYHGARDALTVYQAVTRGISGSRRAFRTYSYENNNPKGLFVTPDLRTAKEFGHTVIEFHTKVSDLEAPVWPGGKYTVQGEMSQMFNSDDEREQKRLQDRMNLSNSEFEYVRNSDRPELALWLISAGERQALFRGDLNPNSIRAIWVSPDTNIMTSVQDFQRISPREFINLYDNQEYGYGDDISGEIKRIPIDPRDTPSGDEFMDAIIRKNPRLGLTKEKLAAIILNNDFFIEQYTWNDRQADRIMNDLERDYTQ